MKRRSISPGGRIPVLKRKPLKALPRDARVVELTKLPGLAVLPAQALRSPLYCAQSCPLPVKAGPVPKPHSSPVCEALSSG